MIKLDCANASIHLLLPPCNEHIARATLTRAHCTTYELQAQVNPSDAPEGTVTFTIPTDPPPARGVWQLTLDTDCGCFTMNVWVDCPPPRTVGTHQPTNEPGPTIVCCEQERQDDWDKPPVNFPLGNPPTGYAVREGQEDDPTGTVLVMTPAPPPQYERWVLRDASGVVRGEGDIADTPAGVLLGYTTCIISPDSWLELTT